MNEGVTCYRIRLREYVYGGQAESTEQSNKKDIFRDFRVFRGQKIELINKEPGS